MTGELRVAAYCRVSTDGEDQVHSLESQRTYFLDYIRAHPGWTFAGIYADEGVSGTSTRRREAFRSMMADAEAGKLDLLLTKEVSRFARNTVDALACTRTLKALGVGVLFLTDGIDTRDNDGELRLTLMASMAQEESRRTSQRVKWGQKRRMEAGVVFGSDSTYGFHTKNGALTVLEEEAEVVRHIYCKFLQEGKGTYIIARELFEEGVPPPRSPSGRWSSSMVLRVLRNEKYAGDLLQKKYVTVDYLTHRKVVNRGQEEQILLRGHHTPIVDRETWDAVQRELDRRSAARGDGSKYSNRYWCSGKLRCGACGGTFLPRSTRRPDGTVYRAWGCRGRLRPAPGTAPCSMPMVNHRTLETCVRFLLSRLGLDLEAMAEELADDILRLSASPGQEEAARLRERLSALERRQARALEGYLSGLLSGEELSALREQCALERQTLERRQKELASPPPPPDEAALRAAVTAALSSPQEVFRAAVEEIVVRPGCLQIRLFSLPETFFLRYTTRGAGESYVTTVEEFRVL